MNLDEILSAIDAAAKTWGSNGSDWGERRIRNEGIGIARLIVANAANRPDTTRTIDRAMWGGGEWDGEPDSADWTHAGIQCAARRNNSNGVWCGYVLLPPGHPWHGKMVDAEDVRCEVAWPWYAQTATHNGLLWALGFDCGHLHDYLPARPDHGGSHYWTLGAVTSVVNQGAAAAARATP